MQKNKKWLCWIRKPDLEIRLSCPLQKAKCPFSPAVSNTRLLLKTALNRKWWDVTQNSPQLWSSLPWPVITAYSSTWKHTWSCWDGVSGRKLSDGLQSAAGALPSWLTVGRGIWLAGTSCCSFCQRFLHRTVTSPRTGGATPCHYLWHHMWIWSKREHRLFDNV